MCLYIDNESPFVIISAQPAGTNISSSPSTVHGVEAVYTAVSFAGSFWHIDVYVDVRYLGYHIDEKKSQNKNMVGEDGCENVWPLGQNF